MACGGFTCSKNALAALNVLYIMVAFILIGAAAYSKAVGYFADLKILGGIIACGVFLLLISIIGLIGAMKHHQVLLFFYMIILFLLFLIQFSIACACLAMNEEQREAMAKQGWKMADLTIKDNTQKNLDCCGFNEEFRANSTESDPMGGPACQPATCCEKSPTAPCCTGAPPTGNTTEIDCPCNTCMAAVKDDLQRATKVAGGIGLFFSFTEIIGVWLALRFRNLKDPRANPSAFL